ncbi:MAG: hypothetical protein APF84_14715 [Gracilibacter sp. BRH_c7a]|nr:MAG: hypothetical protein APF84_14715 [Gracilibacter sp. BRH_c7a]
MNKKRILYVTLCLILMMLVVVGCGESSSSSSADLKDGDSQSLKLIDDVLVCSSKENVEKMISYIRKSDLTAVEDMQLSGQATILKSGTIIKIIDDGNVTEIETQSGEKWFGPREIFENI